MLKIEYWATLIFKRFCEGKKKKKKTEPISEWIWMALMGSGQNEVKDLFEKGGWQWFKEKWGICFIKFSRDVC